MEDIVGGNHRVLLNTVKQEQDTAERKSTCCGFNFLILRHRSVKTHKFQLCHLMKRRRAPGPAITHLLHAFMAQQ